MALEPYHIKLCDMMEQPSRIQRSYGQPSITTLKIPPIKLLLNTSPALIIFNQ